MRAPRPRPRRKPDRLAPRPERAGALRRARRPLLARPGAPDLLSIRSVGIAEFSACPNAASGVASTMYAVRGGEEAEVSLPSTSRAAATVAYRCSCRWERA